MREEIKKIQVQEGQKLRLDAYLAKELPGLSRSRIQKLLKEGRITLEGQAAKASYYPQQGDVFILHLPQEEEYRLEPEEIPLEILYEDEALVVINKPQGMVVHPAAGHWQGTLVNALMHHCPQLSGINGEIRMGIVHRLDKDTSGLLVAAKDDAAHLALTRQWKSREIKRVYTALVHGEMPEPAGRIDAPVGRHPVNRKKMAIKTKGGRAAITHYRALERFPGFTLIEAQLETGRTHQIRVHMSHLGHAVVGDALYGPRRAPFPLQGQLLHASTLGFRHPVQGEYMEFTSPLPEYFQAVLKELRKPK